MFNNGSHWSILDEAKRSAAKRLGENFARSTSNHSEDQFLKTLSDSCGWLLLKMVDHGHRPGTAQEASEIFASTAMKLRKEIHLNDQNNFGVRI